MIQSARSLFENLRQRVLSNQSSRDGNPSFEILEPINMDGTEHAHSNMRDLPVKHHSCYCYRQNSE
jgi:hypothetical protein